MIHRVTHLARVGLVALLLATGLAWAFSGTLQGVQALCVNLPHVSGVNIVKCDGTTIHLRGANQASAYNFQSDWTNTSKSNPDHAFGDGEHLADECHPHPRERLHLQRN